MKGKLIKLITVLFKFLVGFNLGKMCGGLKITMVLLNRQKLLKMSGLFRLIGRSGQNNPINQQFQLINSNSSAYGWMTSTGCADEKTSWGIDK